MYLFFGNDTILQSKQQEIAFPFFVSKLLLIHQKDSRVFLGHMQKNQV